MAERVMRIAATIGIACAVCGGIFVYGGYFEVAGLCAVIVAASFVTFILTTLWA